MNRHDRRAKAKHMHLRNLERGLREIQAEGQGVWNMRLITPDIFLQALSGDADAAGICLAVADAIKRLAAVSPPLLCLLCDSEFGVGALPIAFIMLRVYLASWVGQYPIAATEGEALLELRDPEGVLSGEGLFDEEATWIC